MESDSVRLRHYSFLGTVNVTCPLNVNKCLFVHWTNRNVHWETEISIRPLDEHKCPLDIQMSIRPLDEQKCPLDIQMSIRPVDEQKCPLDIQMSIRPVDEWTLSNGKYSSLLSTWGQTQSNYVITASLAL